MDPISYAIRFGILILLKQLIVHGRYIDPPTIDEWGLLERTSLHQAAGWLTPDVVQYLIDKGVDINAVDINEWTPLHLASFCGKVDNVETLINNGAKLDSVTLDGRTPLHLAIQKDHVQVVDKLLATGRYNSQTNLLHSAAWENSIESLKLLLDKFPVDDLDYHSKTPFMIAVENDRPIIAKMLLERGAKLVIPTIQDESVLHYSVRWNQIDWLKLYLEQGMDPNLKNKWGTTLLHVAVTHANIPIIQFLLDKGADPHIKNNKGNSALDLTIKGLTYQDEKFEKNQQTMQNLLTGSS